MIFSSHKDSSVYTSISLPCSNFCQCRFALQCFSLISSDRAPDKRMY